MRKYNATGHFRLLNQLRSELKSQPIIRQERQAEPTGRQGSPIRTVEVRPQGFQGAAADDRCKFLPQTLIPDPVKPTTAQVFVIGSTP